MERFLFAVVVLGCVAGVPGIGVAQEGVEPPAAPLRLAVAVAQRGLTIGQYNLMLGVEGGLLHVPGSAEGLVTLPLRFGLTEDLEVFASPVLETVRPHFYEPAIGATYRLTHGDVEVGVTAAADLARFGPDKHATLRFGAPVRIHAGRWVAIDTGAFLRVSVDPSTFGGVEVPVGVTLSLCPSMFAGIESGLVVPNVPQADDTVGAPLGFSIGGTIADGDRPLFDVGLRMRWDNLRDSDRYVALAFARLYLFP